MNKYNLKEYLKGQLAPHPATLKSTSYDEENQEYLCSDSTTQNVYDFDAYVAANYPAGKLPASPDAIVIGNKQLYFVEFKNQLPANINTRQLQNKFRSGTEILKNMLEAFIPRDCTYSFCVVFKPLERPRYFDSRHVLQAQVRFELDALNQDCGSFYDQILTEDVDFFRQEFPGLQC